MSVYCHAMKTFLFLFTALVVYILQHNIDRSASSRSGLHISSIRMTRKHQYSFWIGFHHLRCPCLMKHHGRTHIIDTRLISEVAQKEISVNLFTLEN